MEITPISFLPQDFTQKILRYPSICLNQLLYDFMLK